VIRSRGAVRDHASPARRRRFVLALLCAFVLVCVSRRAPADQSTPPDEGRTFEYTTIANKQYLRAVLEELGLLGLGLTHYFANQEVNSADWDLDYDWPSMRAKLVGDAYAFDTNHFDTNFVSHPGAGMLYYLAARGNRLSVLESLGFAFVSSAVWEYAGEYRELVSVNDLVVTPFAGFTLGESTTAIGAFFDRSCRNSATATLGSVFGWSKSVHDAVDGLEPGRDTECDRLGLSRRGDHRFQLFAGNAALVSEHGESASGEARFGAAAEILHLRGLGRPGRGWLSFSDGNVASLSVAAGVDAHRVSDLTVAARTVPFGLHYRSLVDGYGPGVNGSEIVVGFLVGSEYAQHRYDRPAGKMDRVFVLDLPASTVMLIARWGPRRLEASLDAGAALAGVDAFALASYRTSGSTSGLSSVTEVRGYSHAAGFALAPKLRLVLDGAELGFDARTDRLYGLGMLDRSPKNGAHAVANETRRRGTIWLSVGSASFPRATFFVDGRQRSGTLGSVSNTRHEVGAGTRIEAMF
jgi:hypothetical protein